MLASRHDPDVGERTAWRVSDDSALSIPRSLDSPAVTIEAGSFGSWWLRVEGYNTAARVKPAN